MHAITFDEPGGPEVLAWAKAPDPTPPGPGEVAIEVLAAGVNNADLLQRQGRYPVPPGAPRILGLECAGRVAAVGEGVAGLAPGDAVCALLTGGGYAERVVVPAAQVLPVPAGLDATAAAALPEAVCTVHDGLRRLARLQPGETLLVHGGGSGIGTAAIQIAAALGVRVLATAGSPRKLDAARGLGADVGIDYREQDFVAETLAATGGRGVDVVLDIVGAPYLRRNLEALAPDGRIVLLGGELGEAPVPLGLLMARRASVAATALRPRGPAQKAAIVAAVRAEVWPMLERGAVRPVVDTVFPIERAGDAHRMLADGGAIGKVVLTTPAGRG